MAAPLRLIMFHRRNFVGFLMAQDEKGGDSKLRNLIQFSWSDSVLTLQPTQVHYLRQFLNFLHWTPPLFQNIVRFLVRALEHVLVFCDVAHEARCTCRRQRRGAYRSFVEIADVKIYSHNVYRSTIVRRKPCIAVYARPLAFLTTCKKRKASEIGAISLVKHQSNKSQDAWATPSTVAPIWARKCWLRTRCNVPPRHRRLPSLAPSTSSIHRH